MRDLGRRGARGTVVTAPNVGPVAGRRKEQRAAVDSLGWSNRPAPVSSERRRAVPVRPYRSGEVVLGRGPAVAVLRPCRRAAARRHCHRHEPRAAAGRARPPQATERCAPARAARARRAASRAWPRRAAAGRGGETSRREIGCAPGTGTARASGSEGARYDVNYRVATLALLSQISASRPSAAAVRRARRGTGGTGAFRRPAPRHRRRSKAHAARRRRTR